jgi:3-deoxy-manno-octulosonate cytidylyltransferase (CMP-KDO synthetase)
MIAGRSLLERVWRIAQAVPGVDRVVVATDDARIVEHVNSFSGESVMTSSSCSNGSERAFDAISRLGVCPDVVINLQGDAVLMPPWILGALAEEMARDRSVCIATPATRLSQDHYASLSAVKASGVVSGTTVTFSKDRNALYFTKGIIPFVRSLPEGDFSPVWQHIGVYAYTAKALGQYVSLSPGFFEGVEQLEQLRALEHGIPIRVVDVSLRGRTMWSVDNPSDVAMVEQVIAKEGELV